MSLTFEKPVGAAVDVKELQYIASLLQTSQDSKDTFRDASVDAADITHYLMSRFGIEADEDYIRNRIMFDLAGADGTFDIPEMVSVLLIPFLKKVSVLDLPQEEAQDASTKREQVNTSITSISKFELEALRKKELLRSVEMHDVNANIIKNVLEIILQDATGSVEPQPLTKDLLIKIFEKYEDEELTKDEGLLNEMIAVASGELNDGAILDTETFKRGLTGDLEHYDENLECRFSTHYEDVFGLVSAEKVKEEEEEEGKREANNSHSSKNKVLLRSESEVNDGSFKRIFTFSQIDYLADTFRDTTQFLLAWTAAIFGYVAYFHHGSYGIQVCGTEDMDKFRCKVAQSIVVWFTVLGIMLVSVTPMVIILSLGNNIHDHSPLQIIFGIAGIAGLIFFPALYDGINNDVISTEKEEPLPFISTEFKIINLSIGSVLLFIQFCNIIRWQVPDSRLTKNKFLTIILRGNGVRGEFGIKQAAVKKIHNLVKNAHDLHATDSGERSHLTTLLNYVKLTEEREVFGGFIWAWKLFLSGNVVDEEGIWMHTRLLAGNFAQFLMILLAFASIAKLSSDTILDFYAPEVFDNHCGSFVDIDNCYFPSYIHNGNKTSLGMGFCKDVLISNETCVDEFEKVPDYIQSYFCSKFSNVKTYSGSDDENIFSSCPQLYRPSNDTIMTAFDGSTTDHFCSSPITACGEINDNKKADCIIGLSSGLSPFDFQGDSCQNYTKDKEDFEQVYDVVYSDEEEELTYQPQKSALQASVTVGLIFTFFSGLSNILVNIPSQIVTVMKFRTGVVETLLDEKFLSYRKNMLNTAYLLGASVWGMLIMCIGIFLLVATLVFLLTYHVTRPYAESFAATLIGVSTTMIVKSLITLFLNKYSFVGFYRKRPVVANISNAAFESWLLATTSGFIVMRALKLIVVVVFNLGRFDRPILAPGVGEVGPVKMDKFPSVFVQDLLSTDAHRHPYIERLGILFLMKLRHGKSFAARAGSMWRLLFVIALMPYLRSNRIAAIKGGN
eukprot:CAMPEP_0178953056 /NCGR_PEP_ID=MMETSP0789-20121207/8201_1 /TAXON_ID=3005 /ORGANISM="Rhizosolenia setigera, Strain CCMP 1694" /LENGTH=1011 /DNA_ID=CAMNT_0020634261 /DNA_START=593 /DNA_END=3628 /DNA_ORIENTATION=-